MNQFIGKTFVQIRGIGRGKRVRFVNYFTVRCRLWHEQHRKQVLVCIKPVAKTGDSLINNHTECFSLEFAFLIKYSIILCTVISNHFPFLVCWRSCLYIWHTPGTAKASFSKSAKRSCCSDTNSRRNLRSSPAVMRSMSAFWRCKLVMRNRIRIVFKKLAISHK